MYETYVCPVTPGAIIRMGQVAPGVKDPRVQMATPFCAEGRPTSWLMAFHALYLK